MPETKEVSGCLNEIRGRFAGPDDRTDWCKDAGTTATFQVGS
ncbi:MAG: hypothetical protein P8K08_27005 [Fuerstiella sp.]|nr:hypothetical protein [Fuerstiella sp.]